MIPNAFFAFLVYFWYIFCIFVENLDGNVHPLT